MNNVQLIGRLTKDPELRYTPGNGQAVCTINLAVDEPSSKEENKTIFISVVVWGKQAENLATYMTKGSMIAINGRLSTRSYEAKDGTKRYVTEVIANAYNGVKYLSSGNGKSKSNANSQIQDVSGVNTFCDFISDDENLPWNS